MPNKAKNAALVLDTNTATLSHETANQPILLSSNTAQNLKEFLEFYQVQCFNKKDYTDWFLRLLEETSFSNQSSIDNIQVSEIASCIRQVNKLINNLDKLVPTLSQENTFFHIPDAQIWA